MIKRAIILIFVGFFFSIIQHSCGRCWDYDVKWTGLVVQTLNCFSRRTLDTTETVSRETVVCFHISGKYTRNTSPVAQLSNFGMISTAIAFQYCERYHRTHTPVSITIKTMFDYSDYFSTGSDITSLFEATRDSSIHDFMTIDELISYLDENRVNFIGGGGFALHLLDDTYASGQQQFEITIVMCDGVVLSEKTDLLMME